MKNKYLLLSVLILFIASTGVAQIDSTAALETVNNVTDDSGKTLEKIIEIVISSLIGLLFLAMIGHMIYVKYIITPRYKQIFDLSYFKEYRLANGKSDTSSSDEDEIARGLFPNIVADWKTEEDAETGEEISFPTKQKHMKSAIITIEEIISIASTNEEVIEELNSMTALVNELETRSFNGSKILMWIATAIAIIPLFFGAWYMLIPMGTGISVYYLASQRPLFLLQKDREGKRGFVDRIIFWALAMMGAAQTVTTVTTWSDGSKSKDDDNSQHWIAMIFAAIIILILAMYMTILAIFSYLRNYVLYY